jgi:hypothetical protein
MWPSFFPPITVGLVREFFLRMLVNSKALIRAWLLSSWVVDKRSLYRYLFPMGAYFVGTIDIHLKLSSNISKLVLSEKNWNPWLELSKEEDVHAKCPKK